MPVALPTVFSDFMPYSQVDATPWNSRAAPSFGRSPIGASLNAMPEDLSFARKGLRSLSFFFTKPTVTLRISLFSADEEEMVYDRGFWRGHSCTNVP